MAPVKSAPHYPQWTREFYDRSAGLPSEEVLVLSKIGRSIWVGSDGGIIALGKGGPVAREGKGWPAGRVEFLFGYGGEALATVDGALNVYSKGRWTTPKGPQHAAAADVDALGKLWLCASDGLWSYDGSRWTIEKRMSMGPVGFRDFICLRDDPARAVAATSRGLFFVQGKRLYFFGVHAREEGLLSDDVRSVAQDSSGQIWATTDRGISIYGGGNGWCSLRGEDKLPIENLKQLELTPWGEFWVGSDTGLLLLKDGKWKYFASKRWLPSDRVNAILPISEGEVWVATDAGLSHLKATPMTLQMKASHYEATLRAHHVRMGYVTGRSLAVAGDISSGSVRISDNDGLWTGLYVAAEAFRYAVTGQEEAKRNAEGSLEAIMRLEAVTGIPGFPARAIRRKGDPGFGNGHPEWHPTEDGSLEWKGDTSSDEIDGHFFAIGAFFDIVDDRKDRERIAAYARRLIDHIIANDYQLVDLDGKPTTWGVWSPKKLNQDDRWRMQRGLNSLEILSYLKTAHHLTGRDEYQERYEDLAGNHHYALNTVKQRQTVLGHQIWHDDRLAYLAYYPLLIYEEEPALRQIYLLSLERTWRQIRPQRNSLWNIMTSAMTGKPHDVEPAVNTLAEYPLDLISWTVRNSHRTDIDRDPERPNSSLEPLPADERPLHEWAANLHELDGGREGMSAMEGTWYLLPYWMGRYHGLIT